MSEDYNTRATRELIRFSVEHLMDGFPPELQHLRGEAQDLCVTLGQAAAEKWLQTKYNAHAARVGLGTRYSDGLLTLAADDLAESSSSDRQVFYEALAPREEHACGAATWSDVSAGRIRALAESSKGQKRHRAKVGHAGRKNANGRIYSKELWRDQINAFTPKVLEAGGLAGAVDHPGYLAGGSTLKDTCILWRSLGMEEDGSVMADFDIIQDHSSGKDLASQLGAGLNLGFSSYGHGSSHSPSDAERAEFGLGEDEDAEILDRNYRLDKIDAVTDPSVPDARIVR